MKNLGLLLWILALLPSGNAFGQTAAGTTIVNEAASYYVDPTGNPITTPSNPVEIITVATRTVVPSRHGERQWYSGRSDRMRTGKRAVSAFAGSRIARRSHY